MWTPRTRIFGAGAAALATCLAVAAPAAQARHRAATPARASLGAIACHQAVNPLQREVSVQATMRPLTATRGLEIKFGLSATTPGQAAAAVVASGLGQWLTPSDPTLGRRPGDIWKLSKAVYNLGAGSYQYAVSFRWLGTQGKVLKTTTLTSSRCTIKELRPDLAVRSVKVTPVAGKPTRDRYLALIVNQGRSASGPFSVQLNPGVPGVAAQTKPTHSLGAGKRVAIRFTGPVCSAADPPSVVADPSGAVDDWQRSNNALTVACPTS
jgi:hypothetical protein